MNTGVIAAFGTLICWTAGTFAFTLASKRADPAAVNRIRLFFAASLLTLAVVAFTDIKLTQLFSAPLPEQWIWLGLSGIIGLTLGDYFAFTAYRILGSSKTSLFSTFAPVAALLLGWVMLHESINIIGIIGMLISTGGIAWFVQSTQKQNTANHLTQAELTKGIVFAILGAVGQGLGLVCAKKGLNYNASNEIEITAMHATWIRMTIGTVAAYSIALFTKNIFKEFYSLITTPEQFKPLITGTIFGPVTGVSLSLLAASQIEVGIAQTIFSLLPITVMAAAILFGNEKISKAAIIASLVGVLGVLILVWRNDIIHFIKL